MSELMPAENLRLALARQYVQEIGMHGCSFGVANRVGVAGVEEPRRGAANSDHGGRAGRRRIGGADSMLMQQSQTDFRSGRAPVVM
jgi:hypothetical protein